MLCEQLWKGFGDMIKKMLAGLCVSAFLAAPVSAQQGSSLDSLRSEMLQVTETKMKVHISTCYTTGLALTTPEVRLALKYEFSTTDYYSEATISAYKSLYATIGAELLTNYEELSGEPLIENESYRQWFWAMLPILDGEFQTTVSKRDWNALQETVRSCYAYLGIQ